MIKYFTQGMSRGGGSEVKSTARVVILNQSFTKDVKLGRLSFPKSRWIIFLELYRLPSACVQSFSYYLRAEY